MGILHLTGDQESPPPILAVTLRDPECNDGESKDLRFVHWRKDGKPHNLTARNREKS
jgi:hypothetical protein